MDYKIPDEIKQELFHGGLSSLIDKHLSQCDFSSSPGLSDLSFEDISNHFKAYVYLEYMQNKTYAGKVLFMRLMCSLEPTIKLFPMIRNFVELNEESSSTDESLESYIKGISHFYTNILDNCMTPKYFELSEKYDEYYLEEVNKFLSTRVLKMDPYHLMTLTKCVIINGMERNYIVTVSSAVNSAYVLFFQRKMTFNDRKKVVEAAKSTISEIEHVLEVNGFTRS